MSDQQDINRKEYIPDKPVDDVPINLTVLVGYLLTRWRIILIASLAGVDLGGIAGGVIKASDAEDIVQEEPTQEEPAPTPTPVPDLETLIEQAASELTNEQKAEADAGFLQILDYKQIVDEQKKALDDSYIMSLDPDTVVKYRIQYLLETDLKDPEAAYNTSMISDDDYLGIEELLGSGYGRSGLNQAFSIKVGTSEASHKVDLERTERLEGEVGNKYKTVLTIYYYAPDKTICESMSRIIEGAVERRTETLMKMGATAKVTLFDKSIDAGAQSEITSKKREKIYDLVGMINGEPGYVNNIRAGIDPAEITYFDRLQGIMPEPKDEVHEEPVEEPEVVAEEKSITFYILVGFSGGLVLSLLWLTIRFNTDGKLHSARELLDPLGLSVLQTLAADKKISSDDTIKRQGYRLRGYEPEEQDHFAGLIEELGDKIRKDGIKQLYIAEDGTSAASKEFSKRISEGSPDSVVCLGGGFDPSADEMKGLLASDSVILLPVFDKTTTASIRSFVEMCRRNGKYVIGSVPVWDRTTR